LWRVPVVPVEEKSPVVLLREFLLGDFWFAYSIITPVESSSSFSKSQKLARRTSSQDWLLWHQ
jgi:hypothetical protein